MPPPVSAKKIGGKPAYELARKQQPVDLKPVTVNVYALEILKLEGCEAVGARPLFRRNLSAQHRA